MIHLKMDDQQAAKNAFKEATTVDPYLAVGYLMHGVVCFKRSQFATALIDFNQAMEVNLQNIYVFKILKFLKTFLKMSTFQTLKLYRLFETTS